MMKQDPLEEERTTLLISNRLRALSAREQLEILLKSLRTVRTKDRLEILRATGVRFITNKAIDILLRFILRNITRGILWTAFYGVIIIIGLILLALFEAYPLAFPSLIAAIIAFFLGFMLFAIAEFLGDFLPFLIRKSSAEVRAQLISDIDKLEYQQKVETLRTTGIRIFQRGAGDSIITTILTGIALFLVGAIMVVITLLLSMIIPSYIDAHLATYLPLLIALAAFTTGFLVPRWVQKRADALLRRLKLR